MGPVSVHARFLMSADRVAVVTALLLFVRTHPLFFSYHGSGLSAKPPLQFRSFSGTVGLAQCSTILSAKVKAGIVTLINSGAIPPSELIELARASEHGNLDSLRTIQGLSPHLRDLVRDAFRKAVTWCFISLIPWSGVCCCPTSRTQIDATIPPQPCQRRMLRRAQSPKALESPCKRSVLFYCVTLYLSYLGYASAECFRFPWLKQMTRLRRD